MDNKNLLIWVLVIVIALFLLSSFGFFGFGMPFYGGMMGMMYGTYGSGMMFFGWIFMTLITVALILFIMWMIKQIQK